MIQFYKLGETSLNTKVTASPWADTAWQNKAKTWIHETLAANKIQLKGEIEQFHVYHWSTVCRVPTQNETIYFKATAPVTGYEITFSAYIKELHPNAMPDLLAYDTENCWMLMRDAGKRMRESLQEGLDWRYWDEVLPQYAALQIQAAQSPHKLLATGIPNRTLDCYSQGFQDIINESYFFLNAGEKSLSEQEYQRLLDLVPAITEKANHLATFAIPYTIHHGDLHDGNIFYNDSRYVFYDWGDICYSHPFFSLRTVYISAEMRFGLQEYSPELHRLRDVYLPLWRDFESEENLQQAFDLASQLWAVSSLFSWYQSISNLEEETFKEYQHVLPSLAQELFAMIKI